VVYNIQKPSQDERDKISAVIAKYRKSI